MKFKIILLFFLFFFNDLVFSNENKILFKVENEIITSLDILNEIKYLNSVNNSFQNIKIIKNFK